MPRRSGPPRPETLLATAALFCAAAAGALAAPVTSDAVRMPSRLPAAVASSQLVSHVAPTQIVSVDFVLPMHDAGGAKTLLGRLYNPKDVLFGKYLTPAQFAARFGASQTDYAALVAWARQQPGLTITQTSTSRTLLGVTGKASAIETAFSTQLLNYRSPAGKAFIAPAVAPALPRALAAKVSAILGLSTFARPEPLHVKLTPEMRAQNDARKAQARRMGVALPDNTNGHGHFGGFDAADLRAGYDMPAATFSGQGQTIAVYEAGGFFARDIYYYKQFNKLPNVPVTIRTVNGYGGGVTDLGVAAEAALDIDMELAIAQNARQVLVYEESPNGAFLVNSLAAVADDYKASVLSISYGTDEAIAGTDQIDAEAPLFTQLAAEGITVFVSAGDDGAYGRSGDGINAADPASQPDVTAVGGTSLYLGPTHSSYLGEEVWNKLGIGGGATGGAPSAVWPIPDYQVPAAPDANGGSATARNTPDVAAVADPFTGVDIFSTGDGGWTIYGGTSASSPLWGGFAALVNQVRGQAGLPRLGFANPTLYAIGDSFLAAFDLHDVIDGSNGNVAIYGLPGFDAGFGYDDATGLGSFDGGQLLGDLVGAATTNTAPPPAPNGFTGYGLNKAAKLSWTADKGAKGYLLFRVDSLGNLTLIKATTLTGYLDAPLQNNTIYQYVLAAVNTGGITYDPDTVYVYTTATPGR